MAMRLISLPTYLPELNPVEHLRDELREKPIGNVIFSSVDILGERLEASTPGVPCWAHK